MQPAAMTESQNSRLVPVREMALDDDTYAAWNFQIATSVKTSE